MTYNTKQKDLIMDVIKNETQEFTIKDIYSKLNDKTGLTTIYRLVDKLVKEGKLVRTINENNITNYQYCTSCDKDNHFYLKCNNCGCLEHIDCDCIRDLSYHILKNHKFITSKDNIIINGICHICNSKEVD